MPWPPSGRRWRRPGCRSSPPSSPCSPRRRSRSIGTRPRGSSASSSRSRISTTCRTCGRTSTSRRRSWRRPGDEHRVKLGLQIPSYTWPGGPERLGETLRDVVQRAEAAGYDSIWVMDHFFQIPVIGPADLPMLEAYTTLAHIAGVTSRVGLGSLVTGVTYRHAGVLAKIVTTLDVLSGGRAWLGI